MLQPSLKQTGKTVKGSPVFNRRLHHRWPLPSTPSSAHPLIARRQFEWIVETHSAEPPSRSHSLCGFAASTTSLDPRVRLITEGRIFRLLTATECHPFLLFEVSFHRRELPPHMRLIAKRLRSRSTALTPIRQCLDQLRQCRASVAQSPAYQASDSSFKHSPGVSGEVPGDHRRSFPYPSGFSQHRGGGPCVLTGVSHR